MTASLTRAGLLAVLILAAPALAQEPTTWSETDQETEFTETSVSRLVAGVREYPARVLRSLLQLAEDPLVLRQLADEPDLLERPQDISPAVPAELHAAIRELSVMPAIVAVAADNPAELQALRELYAEAPQEVEQHIVELRAAYDQSAFEAAVAWQAFLERDPGALDEYRKLVTRFCQAQLEAYPDFPCVQVTDRDYYYACPPSEAIIFHALEHAGSSAAMKTIEPWWEIYAPYELDARVLGGEQRPTELTPGPDTIAALPPAQRASMWKAVVGGHPDSVDLVPVVMQPPADQPPEAHYARAVAEHARLWTPEPPLEAPDESFAEQPYQPVDDALAMDEVERLLADERQYVDIEEPVQDVVYDDDVYDYTSNWTYASTTYPRIRYHTYYAPVAVYYCGYPVDWPLFYGCDPSWLSRFRICVTYTRCAPAVSGHWYYRNGVRTSYYRPGSRRVVYYDSSRRYGHRGVVRVGRRYYSRCSYSQIPRVLHDRRTSPRVSFSRTRLSDGRTRPTATTLLSRLSRPGSRPSSYVGRSSTTGIVRTPTRSLRIPSRSSTRSLRPAPSTLRRTPGVSPRSRTSPRPSTIAPRRSSPTRSPSISPRSRTSPRPSTIVPRRSSPSRSPSISPRSRTSPRPRSIVPRRSTARHSPSVSPRSRTSPRPSSITPRRSSPSRSPSVSPRSRTSSKPPSIVPRRSGPSRSPSVSPRSRTSSKPPSVAPRRSGPSRTPSVSPRSRTSSKPRSVAPRPSSTPRRTPGISSRRSTSSRSAAAASPRKSHSDSRQPSRKPRPRR